MSKWHLWRKETLSLTSRFWLGLEWQREFVMTGLSRETRLQIMLDDAELAVIDDYRFKQRIPSRAAAIRELLRLGLDALAAKHDRGMRSTDYGVLRKTDGSAEDLQSVTEPEPKSVKNITK